MKWITRSRPKIDRIACPWLITRFIDRRAEFIFVPVRQVVREARTLHAIPFDVPGVELTHRGDECTFDALLKKYDLNDAALSTLARIVRGADTDRHDLAAQSAGLWAIFSGLSYNVPDDHELLRIGMIVYDGLYSWAQHLQDRRHTQNPIDAVFLEIHRKFLAEKKAKRKPPAWVTDLREMIQDQIDTNLSLSLRQLSQTLHVHPAYLSREFSKYFDDLSFGEYIRKLRIEKAMAYMEDPKISLAQIAYLTGFSDQSHFTRIFKKHTGQSPSEYRRRLLKK
jgi:hypothetical protein